MEIKTSAWGKSKEEISAIFAKFALLIACVGVAQLIVYLMAADMKIMVYIMAGLWSFVVILCTIIDISHTRYLQCKEKV